MRRNEVEGMESGVRQGRYSAREKRGQLADGHGAEEIWIEYTLGVVKRGRGWLLSCFSVARTDSNRRLRITGNTTPSPPLSHFFLTSSIRVDSRSFGSSLGPAESSCTPPLLAGACTELRDRLTSTSSTAFLDISNNSNLGFSREDKLRTE